LDGKVNDLRELNYPRYKWWSLYALPKHE
jgi:hypothetical protein